MQRIIKWAAIISVSAAGLVRAQDAGEIVEQPLIQLRVKDVLVNGRFAPKVETGGYMGIVIKSLDQARREELKLGKRIGVAVDRVEPGSPAEQAGILPGDVLEKFDDQFLVDAYQLVALTRNCKAGDEVKLTLIREKRIVVTVKIVEKKVPALEERKAPEFAKQEIPMFAPARLTDEIAPLIVQQLDIRDAGIVLQDALVAVNKTPRLPKVPPGRLDAITWSDEENVFELTAISDPTQRARGLHLVVKNLEGTFVFDGPINTDEEKKALPKDIADKLQAPNVAPILDFMRGIPAKAAKVEKLIR